MPLTQGLPFLHSAVWYVCVGMIAFSIFLVAYVSLASPGKVRYVCAEAGQKFQMSGENEKDAVITPYKTCYNVDFPRTIYDSGKMPDASAGSTVIIKDSKDLMKHATTKPPKDAALLATVENLFAMNNALRLNVCPYSEADACLATLADKNYALQYTATCGKARGSFPCIPRSTDVDAIAEECASYGRLPGVACDASKQIDCDDSLHARINVCQALAGANIYIANTSPPGRKNCHTTCCDGVKPS